MIVNTKKTKTGYKFKIAGISISNKIFHATILCSHTKNENEAKERALKHFETKILSFKKFPTLEEYKNLEISF